MSGRPGMRDRIGRANVPGPRLSQDAGAGRAQHGRIAAAAGVGPTWSAPAPSARGSRWRMSRWSLRTRLLAAVVLLMSVLCAAVGVVSVMQMRSYLQDRLDREVASAAGRTVQLLNSPPDQRPGGVFALGQQSGTLIATVASGKVTDAVVLSQGGQSGQLPGGPAATAPLAAVPTDQNVHSLDLGPGLGTYRVLAVPINNNTVAVTGLPTSDVDATVFRLSMVIAAMAAAGLALTVLAGAAIIRLALRPLRRVAATAAQVSTLPLHTGEVALAVRVPEEHTDPRTEVGQVGAALNTMLGHVAEALTVRQESETRVRQFVADASHELRTPLAAIRGYTDLAGRSPEPVPVDVTHALSRVRSQTVRMSGLVEDLLLLASLDSGRQLEREPVELTGLLIDAVSDAHAAGPGHVWRLDLPDDDPFVTVTGEEARLTQVVVNLLANARTHTPAGTTVTVGLRRCGNRCEVSVSDDGPGIPTQLQPEVFERFARGDSSRSRAAGSTGLGLSIVSAIVAAHQGEVAVHSRPGCTRFVVRLPITQG